MDEIRSLGVRIAVMYPGDIVVEVDPRETSKSELGLLMAGAKPETQVDAN